jgi:hypothetical protein
MPDTIWIFALAVIVLLPFFFMAALSTDQLVRRLYEQHREAWKLSGSPRGFFWKPPEELSLTSGLAFMKTSMWAFRLPPPLRNDPSVQRPLLLLRIGLVVWNAGVLALFGFLILTHRFP